MRCGAAEVPYIYVASDNALLSCSRSSYTISSAAEMGVPLQSMVRASPARGHRAHADDDSVPGAGTVGRVGVPPEVKTPLGIYLQRHSPLSPELWLHYSRKAGNCPELVSPKSLLLLAYPSGSGPALAAPGSERGPQRAEERPRGLRRTLPARDARTGAWPLQVLPLNRRPKAAHWQVCNSAQDGRHRCAAQGAQRAA